MVVRMGAREARNQFADLLGSVRYGKQVVIVERAGQPMAALIPVEMYEQLVAEREARFQVLNRVRERLSDLAEGEVAAGVAEAIAEARSGAVVGRPRHEPEDPVLM